MNNNPQQAFCRVAWKIGKAKGHGEWFDIEEERILRTHVQDLNKEYGPGTHKIEYDDGKASLEEAQRLLNKIRSPKAMA